VEEHPGNSKIDDPPLSSRAQRLAVSVSRLSMLAVSVSQHTLELFTVYDYAASKITFSSVGQQKGRPSCYSRLKVHVVNMLTSSFITLGFNATLTR
jgi:hypothetical protein